MAEEELAVASVTASPSPLDHKRKLEDLEAEEASPEQTEPSESNGGDLDSAATDEAGAKRPRLDGEPDASVSENGHKEENAEEPVKESDDKPQSEEVSGQVTDEQPVEDTQEPSVQNTDGTVEQENQPLPLAEDYQGDDHSSQQEQPASDDGTITRRMEIPNNKVGVLIGKSGETIRYLQYNSGAKIQITKDIDSDPHSTTRPVEMVGTLESVKKAEKLINAVIAEAEAGGSPSLVARGHGASQAASEQIEIQVPNEKVGVIIGKGGETIKGLQTRSGARIQLIPQHLPDGDESKERTVRVTGDKRQIEIAREMIKDVMNQPARSSHSGGFNQQGYRPRGPPGPHQWGGPRGHQNSYDYQQRGRGGPYSSHNQQYPPPYRGYPQQMGPRGGGYNSGGWDQRPPPNMHQSGGGYDYYGGQKGHLPEPGPAQHSGPPLNSSMGPPHSQGNYNYGQHQGQDYGHHPAPYAQSAHHQQSYGHGYDDHGGSQHRYGGSQPYQHAGAPTSYGPPQQYPKPPYGVQSQAPPPQSYGPPRPNQPSDAPPYQGQAPPQPYPQSAPAQQQPYPYASAGPTQQTYPSYGSAPAPTAEGYNQAAAGSGYPQQGVQSQPVASYGQPTATYVQAGPAAGYGQYPSQQGYADPNAAGYGYQDPAAYGAAPAATPAAPAGQIVYSAQATTGQGQQSYDQSGGQQPAGSYGVGQPNASAGYGGKTVSPQPQPQPQPQTAYAQYDSSQMYTAPH